MTIQQSRKPHHWASIVSAYLVTMLIVISSGVLAYQHARDQDSTSAGVMRSQLLLGALNEIETTMTDAETGQRGYLLTGQDQFLEPYQIATGAGAATPAVIQRPPINELLASIRKLKFANGTEQELLHRVDALVHNKLEELQTTIALRRIGKTEEALAIVRGGQGKRIMDALRGTLSAIRADEKRQLEENETRQRRIAQKAYLSAIVSCVVSSLAITLLLAAMRRSSRALLREEQRFEMLANHMGQHAWTLDATGRFQWFNLRWKEYTGEAGSDLDTQWRATTAHPAHQDRVARGLRHAIETGEYWQDVFPLLGRNGEWRWFLVCAVPIRDHDGRVLHWFGTNTDIDERMHLEQELKDGNRRKDEFIATLAHELRNPLAPIQAGLELMRICTSLPPPLKATREIMTRQMRHLVRLIDDLLDISRINIGKLELQCQNISVRSIVETALEVSRLHIESSGHTLDVCLPAETLVVSGDPVRLAQVMSNLLNNAAKYTPEGGLIRVVAERQASDVAICVIDNGIGIDPAVLPDIFDLFSQASSGSERRQGGIGIGLSIARKLVDMHDGTLTAKSAGLGQGSCFTVRLPLAQPEAAASGSKPASKPEFVAGQESVGSRIMILDDNVDAAQTLAALLDLAGHDVELAHTGQDAIDLAQRFKPEVAFLDIGLPDMSGYDVARALRREPSLSGIRLIALTGWGATQDRIESAAAGFDHHLTKPVSLQTLSETLPDIRLPRRESIN